MEFIKGLLYEANLTPGQYRKANKAMAASIVVIMVVFCLLEATTQAYANNYIPAVARYAIYVVAVLFAGTFTQKHADKKVSSIVMASCFAICYAIFIFSNDAYVMAIVFPALLTMVVYMNGKLIMSGSIVTIIIVVAKAVKISASANLEPRELLVCNLMLLGIVICMFCGCNAIRNIAKFSNQSKEKVIKKAQEQAQVAETVAKQVTSLDNEFQAVVKTVTEVGETLESAIASINDIAKSTEDTANAAETQAGLTAEIQSRLENTNTSVENAMEVTNNLLGAVVEGKAQSDELDKQSDLVDANTTKISGIVDNLVENVAKVSNITESILAISAQTNLLALNASIEAARAGEAGKGFAVVADQIRSLAEETKSATEMITEIIDELNGVTTETQAGIRESVESINKQRQKVQEVNDSFEKIEQGMKQMSSEMSVVGEHVGKVLTANQTIVDSISTLTATSEEVTASTATNREEMESLGNDMSELSGNIDTAFAELQILRDIAVDDDEDDDED